MKLHQEELGIYEALGDTRSRAVTLGDIARIRRAKGQVDEAMKLHQEMLGIFEALGDADGKANALWSMAEIELQRTDIALAREHLGAAYGILLKIGRLDGIAVVGVTFGQVLCAAGETAEGLAVLARSRDGFRTLDDAGRAEQVQGLIDEIEQEQA